MRKYIIALFLLLCGARALADDKITGHWTTIDDETNTPKSVVRIYEYQGKYFGRVVHLFANGDAKAKLPDSPPIQGLDIIWDLEKSGDKYKGGEILDPKKGKVYGCEIWREGDDLIVRGKIAFLGRNQTWHRNSEFQGIDVILIPKKPRLK